jgi:hypothetical protein
MNRSLFRRAAAILWICLAVRVGVSCGRALAQDSQGQANPSPAQAGQSQTQSKGKCLTVFSDPNALHTGLDCLEALFSNSNWHFTLSSVPPGNGFVLGGVAERKTHYVSPEGRLSYTTLQAAVIGSTNESWVTTASLMRVPALYKPDRSKGEETCQRLGPLCTKTQLALHLGATHRSVQTIAFYGTGPRSTALKHTFHQNDTFGAGSVSLPLTNNIATEGGLEILAPDLPPTGDPLSVSNSFSNATTPGLASQPTFLHPHIALLTKVGAVSNPVTDDDPLNRTGPLMKRNLRFSFNNGVEYHWYPAVNSVADSFERLVLKGDEAIAIGSNVRRRVTGKDVGQSLPRRMFYGLLRNACGNGHEKLTDPDATVLKVTAQCNYGMIDLRSQMIASYTGSGTGSGTGTDTGTGSAVPFYLEPTVGGSDINSQVSLRGFADYRFRDRDAVFVQAEYAVPIVDPVGLLLFYDAGTVGPTVSSLSFAHLRQDAGAGATFRVQNNVVAQLFLAWGAGDGPTLGYNFTKFF